MHDSHHGKTKNMCVKTIDSSHQSTTWIRTNNLPPQSQLLKPLTYAVTLGHCKEVIYGSKKA